MGDNIIPISAGESGTSYPTGKLSVVSATRKPKSTDPSDEEKREIHKTAMERFRVACDAEADWRSRAQEELEFVDDGKHWSDAALKERSGRPCLTFDLISGSIDQVVNNVRQSPPEPRIAGVGIGRDRVDAAIIQGVLRNIDNDSAASVAWTHAFMMASKMGRGSVKVDFEYEEGDEFLQRIKIRRVLNPFSHYYDPSASEFDFSDMGWAFETDTMSKDEFEDEHPGAKWRPASSELESGGDPITDWFPKDSIRIANYWWIEKDRYTIWQTSEGLILRHNPGDVNWVNKREVVKKKVRCARMTGAEVLKVWDWPRGSHIPLIPVIAKESVIKGKRKLRGMVRPAMDANLAYDYARSKEAEQISLSSISQWMAGVKAIEGFEGDYAASNTKAIAVLKWNETDEEGRVLQAPHRVSPEPESNALAIAIKHADDDRKTMLQTWDANLGAPGPEQSGRAIGLRQRQGDNAHYDLADNLGRSIRLATIIILDLMPVIYSEQRELMIADPDGSQKIIKINQDFEDPKDGKTKNYALGDDTIRYHVTIGTGPSFASRRAEQTERIMQIGQSVPASLGPVLDLTAQLLDLPDEFAKRWRPPNVAAEQSKEEGGGPDMQQLQQGMAQSQQMIQQLTAQLNSLSEEIKTKKYELESKERIAAHGDETKLAVAAIAAKTEAGLALLQTDFQNMQNRLNLLHDHEAMVADQQFQASQQQQQQQAAQQAAQQQPQPAGAGTPAEGSNGTGS